MNVKGATPVKTVARVKIRKAPIIAHVQMELQALTAR